MKCSNICGYIMPLEINPIGLVKPITQSEDQLLECEAEIELLEDTRRIIDDLKGYSHIIVIAYLKGSDRTITEVAKVINCRDNVINVKMHLKETADVLNIRPYDVFKDCIYSASTPQNLQSTPKNEAIKVMLKAAKSFHGALCAGVAIGVRMLYRASIELDCDPRSRDLTAVAAVKACVADGIQGAMGATNKRFRAAEQIDGTATFTYGGRAVKIRLAELTRFHDAKEVYEAEEDCVISRVEKFIL